MLKAALNVANAIGASAGAASIGAGFGLLACVWAGFALTLGGWLSSVSRCVVLPNWRPHELKSRLI